jgi:hypothetical protein
MRYFRLGNALGKDLIGEHLVQISIRKRYDKHTIERAQPVRSILLDHIYKRESAAA